MKRISDKNIKSFITVLFLVFVVSILGYSAASQSLWSDEVFSLKLVGHSWKEMFSLDAQDVHPPLYYIILKLVVDFGSFMNISPVFAGKICSCIPFLLCITSLRKMVKEKSGEEVADLFALCSVGMPNMLNYAIEIRQYSWAMFFVTASFLFSANLKENCVRDRNWTFFTVFSILAAYTHYFACVAVTAIYLLLLIHEYKNFPFLKRLIFSGFFLGIAYLPWIFIFAGQFVEVAKDYWIGELTWATFYGYFRFLFEPPMAKLNMDVILGVLLAAIYVFTFVKELLAKENKENTMMYGGEILIFTVLAGIIVSFLVRPVFVSRYMIVAAGCFWLGYACLFHFTDQKKVVRVLAVWVTLLVCLIDVGQFVRWEKIRKGYYKEFSELTAEVQEEDVVFSDHEHIQICLSWYLNQDAVGDAADLTSYLEKTDGNSNRQVWYFSSVQDRGVESEIEKYYDGNEIENVGEYHLENYTFSVKRMKKENV